MFHVPIYFSDAELIRSAFFLSSEKELIRRFEDNPLSFFDNAALRLLDDTRELAGIPFVLTCSYRSKAYEASKNRSGNSAHTQGCAFDIRVNTPKQRYKIVQAAIVMHWPRIGIAEKFVHLDCSSSLPQHVCWTY